MEEEQPKNESDRIPITEYYNRHFIPCKDITAYELACIISEAYKDSTPANFVHLLPESAQRHFA